MTYVFFIYGLAYFSMGLAIVLESTNIRGLRLARSLLLLGLFGLIHGIVEWLDMAILISNPPTDSSAWAIVEASRLVFLAVSALCLAVFGTRLLADSYNRGWVPWIPAALLIPSVAWIGAGAILTAENTVEWLSGADAVSRYFIYFPANAAAALAFYRQRRVFMGRLRPMARYCYGAVAAFGFNSVIAGLIVPSADFFPASAVNYASFAATVGIPVQVLRAGSALVIAYTVVRMLRVFDIETRHELEVAIEERTRARQEKLEVELRAQNEIRQWNRELEQRTKELSALVEASKNFASTIDLDTLLERIVRKTVEIVAPADICAIFLFDPSCGALVLRSAYGYKSRAIYNVRIAPGEALVGKSFSAGDTLLYPTTEEVAQGKADLRPENRTLLDEATSDLPEAKCALATPLTCKNRVIGTLFLENRFNPSMFSNSDIQLAQALADQMVVAIENAQLYEELYQKEEIRGQLLQKVISAQEDERKRIARELHDETSQALTVLIISLESAEESLPPDQVEVKHRLQSIRELTVQTLEEIRMIIMDLRPTLLDDLGLIPALRWYSKTQADRFGLRLNFRTTGFVDRLPLQMETVLFRVVQEAITNVARHAGAGSVNVRLQMKDATITATIEDDGKGFQVGRFLRSGRSNGGFGLLGMKERVNLLGGTLVIDSEPGRGTRVTVEVPVTMAGGEVN